MRFTDKHKLFLVTSLLLCTTINAQSINLYTFNNGGGSNSTMEWSIGESASIAYSLSCLLSMITNGIFL